MHQRNLLLLAPGPSLSCAVRLVVYGMRLPVVLHEHQIPDLHNVRTVHVDERGGVPIAYVVVVDLGARATWPRLAHLPEIVLHSERKNAIRVHAGRRKKKTWRML